MNRRARLVAAVGVLLVLLTACRGVVGWSRIGGEADTASGEIGYDTSPSAVVLSYSTLPPYHPAASTPVGRSPWLKVYGDGRFEGRLGGSDRQGTIPADELRALLRSIWDDGLFDNPDLGVRVYDAGEEHLTVTANGRTAKLMVTGVSEATPAVKATRAAIARLQELTR